MFYCRKNTESAGKGIPLLVSRLALLMKLWSSERH